MWVVFVWCQEEYSSGNIYKPEMWPTGKVLRKIQMSHALGNNEKPKSSGIQHDC